MATTSTGRPTSEPAAKKRASARGDRTREQILDAAEHLYGERGIDGVTLREIREAAGQRNTSAIQFHFGDAEALHLALVERHMPRIGAIAEALRAQVAGQGQGDDPAALTGVMVACYADYLELGSSERSWLRIASTEATKPERLLRELEAHAPSVLVEIGSIIYDHLSTLMPSDLAVERITAVGNMGLHLCADRARALDATGPQPRRRIPAAPMFRANLVEMARGAMLAPAPAH